MTAYPFQSINGRDDHKNRRSNRFENVRSNTLHPGCYYVFIFIAHNIASTGRNALKQIEQRMRQEQVKWKEKPKEMVFISSFFSLVISMENRSVFYVRYINIMLPALRQIHFNCFKGSASFYEHCKINSLQNIMLEYFILHCYFSFLMLQSLLCFALLYSWTHLSSSLLL